MKNCEAHGDGGHTMTYRDKLRAEHPAAVGDVYVGGAARCPCSFGYEDGQACMRSETLLMTCRECWDREIPANDKKQE